MGPMEPISMPLEFNTDCDGIWRGLSRASSGRFKGVMQRRNKWVAEIRVPKHFNHPDVYGDYRSHKIWLGTYTTALEAAFAHDVATKCLRPKQERLNFYHPIYERIPHEWNLRNSSYGLKRVVRDAIEWAKRVGNFAPMMLASNPKDNTMSGGSLEGLPGTSPGCPDLCPECGKTFLESQSMLHHLMEHWENQKFSSTRQFSSDFGGEWWSMYRSVRYWQLDATEEVANHNSKESSLEVYDKWAIWIPILQNKEILLGLYSTTLEAAYAYDIATTCLGGKPLLNFYKHSIYTQIPKINLHSMPLVLGTELKKVLNEFGKLVLEGGYCGGLKQEKASMEFIDMFIIKKSKQDEDILADGGVQQDEDILADVGVQQDEDILADAGVQQVDSLNSFLNNKRPRLCMFSRLDDDSTMNESTRDFLNSLKLDKAMLEITPPHSSLKEYDTSNPSLVMEPADAKDKAFYEPFFLGHGMPSGSPHGALKFTMDDLKIMTENFSESLLVGQERSGSTYRGQFKDGTIVAVKRIQKNDQNVTEMEVAKDIQFEVDTLCKEEHVNLVRLLGFVENEDELFLVMEYMTNGNLRQHLHGISYGGILDMSKRCVISLDVVAALRHIHNQTKDDSNIIHRDIKSSDILITNDFHAKVAGFGLSRHSQFGDPGASSSSTQVKGTLGCMAPKLSTTHHLKEKNDVYTFGELLVEIFTKNDLGTPRFLRNEVYTPRWVLKQCVEGRLMDIIDANITPTMFNLKILEQIFKLAASCLIPEENKRPNVEDVWRALSIIVGHYFLDVNNEANLKESIHEVQTKQKCNLEGSIEPFIETLCLKESKELEGHEPTVLGDKIDSSNSSFIPFTPHCSTIVKNSSNNKVQTSTQLDTQLDVDSNQSTRQTSKVLKASQDQTSPLFINIFPGVCQLESDETYLKMLQEKIEKLGYISRLLNQGDECHQSLSNSNRISFFLYFNEKDDVFEFYFDNYEGMASIVGVGLEHGKVVLKDGWRVVVQEILKPNWNDAWKNFDSSSNAMKVTIPEPLEENMDNMEDIQKDLAFVPKGKRLLLDLAQYFILNKAIASFSPRNSMTQANLDGSSSSTPSNEGSGRSSSSNDQLSSRFFQTLKNIFSLQNDSNQLETKNVGGSPTDPLEDEDVKIDTTVELKLLHGGCLYDGDKLVNETISNDEELKTLTSQLDNTICLELTLKFLKEDDRKEIQVIIGPISFDFLEENEENFEKNGRFGWYHNSLDVSFGPTNASHSEIGFNHKALDVVDWKSIKTIESLNSSTPETSKTLNGEVKGSIPHVFTLKGGGSLKWSESQSKCAKLGESFEKPSQMTYGQFFISPRRYRLNAKLKYSYWTLQDEFDIDLQKLADQNYQKLSLNHPMCIPQVVRFEGSWFPKELEGDSEAFAQYSLIACRKVFMTSKCVSGKTREKLKTKRFRISKIQKLNNEPLKYIQKYSRKFFLNHAMTHLNGEKFKVRECLDQQSLNGGEMKTHLEEYSFYKAQWNSNPLLGLDS